MNTQKQKLKNDLEKIRKDFMSRDWKPRADNAFAPDPTTDGRIEPILKMAKTLIDTAPEHDIPTDIMIDVAPMLNVLYKDRMVHITWGGEMLTFYNDGRSAM